VACPSCHANLDGRQLQVADLVHKLPFAQLMALAFGAAPKAAGLHKNLVDPLPLLREKDMVEAN
jgi:heterodisulfide reductase subunit B